MRMSAVVPRCLPGARWKTALAISALLAFAVPVLAAPVPASPAPPASPASPPPPASPAPSPSPAPEAPKQAPKADPAARSEAVVDQFVKAEYDAIFGAFDATMKSALPKDKLKAVWEGLVAQVGTLKSHGKAEISSHSGLIMAIVPMTFERAELVAQIAWNDKGEISGLWFKPPAPKQSWAAPSYIKPGAFSDTEVVAGSPGWLLPATLSMPAGDGPFPGAVLVHGSGPQDRDETVGGAKVFRDLAGGLATRGIAVLRYEKRTKEHGARIAAQKGPFTLDQEVVDDALAAVTLLRRTVRVDPVRIFVLGHSLGAAMTPEIARRDPRIAGIISMAGPTRSIEELMREQTAWILSQSGAPADVQKAKLAELDLALAKVQGAKPGDGGEPVMGAPPSYWASLHAYRPIETAKALRTPFLILQGERDYQVTMKDLEGWRAALAGRPNVVVRTYPKLNHLFIEGEGPSVPAEYEQPGHVSPVVVDDIASWILRRG